MAGPGAYGRVEAVEEGLGVSCRGGQFMARRDLVCLGGHRR